MMKTRIVNSIGVLNIGKREYFLIRIEASQGFAPNVSVFTVMDCTPDKYDKNGESIYREPYLLATTAGWIVEYHFPLSLFVEDTTETEVNVIELDIPTPAEISEAEWERMLNDVDTHRFDTETENVE